MINIEPIGKKPFIINLLEGGDRHTIELFMRLLEVLIHNLRIENDSFGDRETSYYQGAINEYLKLYNTLKPKPEKKREI